MFDLEKLGRASFDWDRPLSTFSKEEIVELGEAFLACIEAKTTEEVQKIKAIYDAQIDMPPF